MNILRYQCAWCKSFQYVVCLILRPNERPNEQLPQPYFKCNFLEITVSLFRGVPMGTQFLSPRDQFCFTIFSGLLDKELKVSINKTHSSNTLNKNDQTYVSL